MLVKATLTHLDSLESLTVQWNPQSYRVERQNRYTSPVAVGGREAGLQFSGAAERLLTRLFFDSTSAEADERDLRVPLARLEDWSRPTSTSWSPPTLLFTWGDFRFRGVVEALDQDLLRFDPDGTPVRAWVDLVLRNTP